MESGNQNIFTLIHVKNFRTGMNAEIKNSNKEPNKKENMESNDDICIHCKRRKEEHGKFEHCGGINCPFEYSCADGCMYPTSKCRGFKSISQHYAEQRGPENLKVLENIDAGLGTLSCENWNDDDKRTLTAIFNIIGKAIEASKPPKE